jgi:RNA polymerase sigma factor (sigma-70 family)
VNRGEERRMLERIRAGERAACEELVHVHYQAIYRYLAYLVRDPADASDLTQETFAAAWTRIAGFEGRSALRTWLYRIACGTFADFRRKRHRAEMLVAARVPERQDMLDASPLEAVLATERTTRVDAAVAALGEDADRIVIVLRYYQDLSFREIASILGEPLGTVKWRTSRAIGRLRQILGERGNH